MALTIVMRIALFVTLWAVLARARLVPRADGQNSPTVTSISPSPTGACVADCSMTFPSLFEYSWVSVSHTSTVTAATVVVIVNTILNVTKTSTIFNTLPDGLTLPPTNSAGTQTCDVTITRGSSSFTTTLTYPEVFRDYEITYEWFGTLSTDGKCSTGSQTTVTLSSHPSFDTYTPTPTNAWETSEFAAAATSSAPPDHEKGLDYACVNTDIEDTYFNPFIFFIQQFPGEAAFRSCSVSAHEPVGALMSVSFVTDTSTSIDDTVPSSPVSITQNPATSSEVTSLDITSSETTTLAAAQNSEPASPAASQSPAAETASVNDSGSSSSSSSTPTATENDGSNSNSPLPANPTPTPVPTLAPIVVTLSPSSSIVLPLSALPSPGGTTVLSAGPSPLTLSATTDGTGQTVVVVSAAGASTAHTITLSSQQLPEPAGQSGLASLILSALGGPGPGTSGDAAAATGGNATATVAVTATAPLVYTGGAPALSQMGWWIWVGPAIGAVVAVVGGSATGM